jgi:serine/threonine protein kinase
MAKQYGKWSIEKSLSEGGQARTYLAVETGAEEKRPYVLKVLKNQNRIQRFHKEVRACSELDHPNVLRVVDYDLECDRPYMVTEYCEGGPLSTETLLDYSIQERLRIFADVCRGVGHAHSKDVIHRDIKPDNVFLLGDRTTPIVGDFGICFITVEGERFTLLDEVAGPRWYAAPELEDGRADDIQPTADVYSLGKLLYWMIAGEIFSREKHREPRFDLTKKDNSIPAYLLIYELLDKMIVGDSSNRFPDANAVADAVDIMVRRIEMNAHSIGPDIPQHCTYCGLGLYQKMLDTSLDADPTAATRNFGFNRIGTAVWLGLVCDYCGNVQVFRPDHAKDPGIWSKR